jgi:HPt (histidine-containing phosphotransfer) domain-containing protein
MSHPDTVLDRSVLDELVSSVGEDRAFVEDLARTFLADAETHLAAIEAARSTDDAEAIVRPAHTLKSSSATLGCLRLASVARILELQGRAGIVAAVAGDGTLAAAWDEASAAVQAWLAGEPS